MIPRRPYPGAGHAVLMTLGVMVLQNMFLAAVTVVVLLVRGGDMAGLNEMVLTPGVLGGVNILVALCVLFWGYAANGVSWSTLLPLRRVPWLALFAVVIGGLGACVVISEIDNVVRAVLPMPEWFRQAMGSVIAVDAHPWATAIVLVVVASTTEEPVFRGVILRGLLGRMRPRTAILISAALFGFVHANPWQFAGAFILGCIFGWYFLRTRSLVPCILGHALNNGVAFLGASKRLGNIPGFSAADVSAGAHQPWWFTAAGAALAALGLWCFARATKAGIPPPLPIPVPVPLEPVAISGVERVSGA